MTTTATYRKGDRVELTSDNFGPLKRGSAGIIVEVYRDYTDYPVAVAWPSLRKDSPPDNGKLLVEGLDSFNLHEGDVVPMHASEIRVTGNIFSEGGEQD